MRKVLLDSSSAILLEKTGLLHLFLSAYQVILTQAVYDELTRNNYPSAQLFVQIHLESLFAIASLEKTADQYETEALLSLNWGERETILQFLSGAGDFIMVDDGKAAKYCDKHDLPFVNALLLPRLLHGRGLISGAEKTEKVAEIIKVGRYSEKIIKLARGLPHEALEPFLP